MNPQRKLQILMALKKRSRGKVGKAQINSILQKNRPLDPGIHKVRPPARRPLPGNAIPMPRPKYRPPMGNVMPRPGSGPNRLR